MDRNCFVYWLVHRKKQTQSSKGFRKIRIPSIWISLILLLKTRSKYLLLLLSFKKLYFNILASELQRNFISVTAVVIQIYGFSNHWCCLFSLTGKKKKQGFLFAAVLSKMYRKLCSATKGQTVELFFLGISIVDGLQVSNRLNI